MADKFKDKLKKEREYSQQLKDELMDLRVQGDASDELTSIRQERDQLKLQINALKKEQLSVIEHLEQSKEFSMYFDPSVREDSVLTSLKKMELNMSQVDQKLGSLS